MKIRAKLFGFFIFMNNNKFTAHYKQSGKFMKKIFRLFILCITLIVCFSANTVLSASAETEKIYLGGIPAGFSLQVRGAYVIGLTDVLTENGLISPAKNADIQVGDKIMYIDGTEVNNAVDIAKNLQNNEEKNIVIIREGKTILKQVKPVTDLNKENKLGLFIRDNINGIGTITFVKGNKIATLGHPILDDSGNIIEIIGGNISYCNITGVVKGKRGKAGELRGVFLKKNNIATIKKNSVTGVYGELINDNAKELGLKEIKIGTAKMGEAEIYSTINGNKPCKYTISIIKVDENNREDKNFVVKITDENLLKQTGGIVQGMSGSPIVQNGKLVGAVTHVFLNDPTRGFGISINNMLGSISK